MGGGPPEELAAALYVAILDVRHGTALTAVLTNRPICPDGAVSSDTDRWVAAKEKDGRKGSPRRQIHESRGPQPRIAG